MFLYPGSYNDSLFVQEKLCNTDEYLNALSYHFWTKSKLVVDQILFPAHVFVSPLVSGIVSQKDELGQGSRNIP